MTNIPIDDSTLPVPLPQATPTVTFYQQLANEFIAALDRITAIIPNLEEAHPANASFVRSRQKVPHNFLVTVTAGVEQNPELLGVKKLDPVIARDKLQFIEAFRPVLDKVVAFARKLLVTLMVEKAKLAEPALQIYQVAKALARDLGSASMVLLVENMKRDLGLAGRTSSKSKATVTPQPAEVRS